MVKKHGVGEACKWNRLFWVKGYEEQDNLVMFYCARQTNQWNGNQENATASDSANDW